MPSLHSDDTSQCSFDTISLTLSRYAVKDSSSSYSGSLIPYCASNKKLNVGFTTTSSSVNSMKYGVIDDSFFSVIGTSSRGALFTISEVSFSFQCTNPKARYATLTPVSSRKSLAFLSIFLTALIGFGILANASTWLALRSFEEYRSIYSSFLNTSFSPVSGVSTFSLPSSSSSMIFGS